MIICSISHPFDVDRGASVFFFFFSWRTSIFTSGWLSNSSRRSCRPPCLILLEKLSAVLMRLISAAACAMGVSHCLECSVHRRQLSTQGGGRMEGEG